MKLHNLFAMAAVVLSLAAGGALAQDEKAKKQAEVRKATQTSLQKFYSAPSLAAIRLATSTSRAFIVEGVS